MSVNDQAAVRFNKVSYANDGHQILKNITGWFPKGRITTLVGPSGAGKTSLFKLCNSLTSPTSGDIYIGDKKIESYDPVELRRMVGMALQNATMIGGTVMKNLALPLELQGKELPVETAEELVKVVGLDESFLERDTRDLSGGQRQKVSIARTLVNRPEILLLDEITSALDRVSQQDIEDLIVRINQKYGTTMIWITHNLQQAFNVGDYTWVMMDGELIEAGESSILEHSKKERVQRFVKGQVE
ncbi:phosphate ABC transporter ATP-binding protein [Jeotgalibacillus soli]|uniref:ABC transporter domain-containing protein n=1 Tax=Jeotgalibacillus soli TaxID=889306 RepID=A0A0C2VK41_9BACL|nr:phosphate ABC transporter ATP-binding protein [Jeotgalibacillus soli]KIL49277.1 hypothetical protein KP78_07450 [Jeotgalibacillus soli]